jgi:hypothetical protein
MRASLIEAQNGAKRASKRQIGSWKQPEKMYMMRETSEVIGGVREIGDGNQLDKSLDRRRRLAPRGALQLARRRGLELIDHVLTTHPGGSL